MQSNPLIEKIKEYNSMYYEKNKTEILAKNGVKIKCEHCDCDVAKWHLSRHNKTKKHKINSQQNQ